MHTHWLLVQRKCKRKLCSENIHLTHTHMLGLHVPVHEALPEVLKNDQTWTYTGTSTGPANTCTLFIPNSCHKGNPSKSPLSKSELDELQG